MLILNSYSNQKSFILLYNHNLHYEKNKQQNKMNILLYFGVKNGVSD